MIQLIIDTALKISNEKVSYNALKLLSYFEYELMDSFFEHNDFLNKLKHKIQENRLLPSAEGKYLLHDDRPVFYKNNYASILPADKFKRLLLHTTDEKTQKTINWIGNFKYSEACFFQEISKISEQLTIHERSKLIYYIIDDYSDLNEATSPPNLFVDEENQVIPSNSEIFLPPSGEKLDIPMKLNLKIINSDLFSGLKKLFGTEKARIVEDKLEFFNVKEYRFAELFKRIISEYKKSSKSLNERIHIKELMNDLHELFILNRNKNNIDISIPSGVSIPILNSNNVKSKVSKVYLGETYGNRLCQVLSEYNKSKLVGSPEILGLQDKEHIIEFLKWLGVSEYPRRQLVTVKETDYKEFVIKSFPFHEKKFIRMITL